jgi:hypothetical protein
MGMASVTARKDNVREADRGLLARAIKGGFFRMVPMTSVSCMDLKNKTAKAVLWA